MKTKRLTKREMARELRRTERATKLERLLRDPKSTGALLYALQAVVVEMSNECQVGIDHPSLAGQFVSLAEEELREYREHRGGDWMGEGSALKVETCFRHLDALLANPTVKNARAVAKYWDANMRKQVDPFPEK